MTGQPNPLLCPECGEPAVRIPRFYVGGRPLYGCANGHRMVDESDEPSFKGLAPLAPFVSGSGNAAASTELTGGEGETA